MIQLVTAADEAFAGMAAQTAAKSRATGYEVEVLRPPLAQPPKLVIHTWSARCPWKPRLILEAMARHPHRTVVYLDADAWVIRPIEELESDAWDVGVTMRRRDGVDRQWPEIFSFLNSGVFVAQPTMAAQEFVRRWAVETERVISGSDQHALNNLVRQATDLTEIGGVFRWEGIRIKVLDCERYNWFYAPEEPSPETKIIHLKTDVRKRVDFDGWLAKTWT